MHVYVRAFVVWFSVRYCFHLCACACACACVCVCLHAPADVRPVWRDVAIVCMFLCSLHSFVGVCDSLSACACFHVCVRLGANTQRVA